MTPLQAGTGRLAGDHSLPSLPDQVGWGWLPNASSAPVLTVASGETICHDTVSHEGLLPDQGRDPVGYFPGHGIPRDQILDADLDEAMKAATRNALTFLADRFSLPRSVAFAYLSATADFEVSQVVDRVKGVHCCLRRADLDPLG